MIDQVEDVLEALGDLRTSSLDEGQTIFHSQNMCMTPISVGKSRPTRLIFWFPCFTALAERRPVSSANSHLILIF